MAERAEASTGQEGPGGGAGGGERVDEQCGVGPWRPLGLQRFARIICFTLSAAFCGFCALMQGPLLVTQVRGRHCTDQKNKWVAASLSEA